MLGAKPRGSRHLGRVRERGSRPFCTPDRFPARPRGHITIEGKPKKSTHIPGQFPLLPTTRVVGTTHNTGTFFKFSSVLIDAWAAPKNDWGRGLGAIPALGRAPGASFHAVLPPTKNRKTPHCPQHVLWAVRPPPCARHQTVPRASHLHRVGCEARSTTRSDPRAKHFARISDPASLCFTRSLRLRSRGAAPHIGGTRVVITDHNTSATWGHGDLGARLRLGGTSAMCCGHWVVGTVLWAMCCGQCVVGNAKPRRSRHLGRTRERGSRPGRTPNRFRTRPRGHITPERELEKSAHIPRNFP